MWAINLRMGKESLKKKNLRVCSNRFNKNDFFCQSAMNKKTRLKMTAIPTQKLPLSKRKIIDIISEQKAQECNTSLNFDSPVRQDHDEPEFENYNSDNGDSSVMDIVNSATQVTSADIEIPFVSLIDSPKKLSTMTGIPSFQLEFPDK
ncbi:THAP-type domain-containing protein, partial [Aphis craccivora]